MNDVEMAMDAYRLFLRVKIDIASNEDSHESYCPPEAGAFEEALEAFDVIFKAMATIALLGEEDVTKT